MLFSDFQNSQSILSNKAKGDAFEQLVHAYFKLDPKYEFYDDVWLFSKVPNVVLEELGLPSQDIGIDLIAKTGDEFHAIQCKFHQDNTQSVTFKEVSTFISLLESNTKITKGYICSTADITSRVFNKLNTKPIYLLLNDTWQGLEENFFDRYNLFIQGKRPEKLVPYQPREHQVKALKNAKDYFVKDKQSRGKLIFPCGAGKSLTGYWITNELKSKRTIIAVPSLSLVKQTLDVYLREIVARGKKAKWLCICSDEGIGKDDDIVYYTENIGVPCQTDSEYIKNWLEENHEEEIYIFTTYQSGRIIAEVSKELDLTFDLGIFDEAHKTVGSDKKLFSHLLFEENISITKRIFMTATERFYKGSKDDIISMDDEDIYGDIFAHMSFKEAIETGLLTDYKVITIDIRKAEIAEFIKENNLVQLNDKWKKETEARSLASMLALRKAMKLFPIKNAVSFHSSIEKAVRNKELQTYITESYNYKPIDTFTVSGKQATSKRNSIVQEFAKSEHSLITNARCLTEGVDVPNIDCIIFSDPRKSKVDIVQALGRALRKKEGKDWGYVILPVIYDDTTQEIDNENFQEIFSIVRGLASNDERIVEYFKDKAETKVPGKVKENQFHLEVFSEFVDESELASQLQIKLWEKLSRFSWMPFEEAREIVRGLGLINIAQYRKYCTSGQKPSNIPSEPHIKYKTSGWISWGDWTGSGNIAPQNYNWLPFEEAREIARSYKINTWEDWLQIENLPPGIPKYPNTTYKSKYNGIKDWLGIEDVQYLSFYEARNEVRSMGINKLDEWKEIVKTPLFPRDIPKDPYNYYKNKGWVNWADWLGTAREESDFLEKRKEVHKHNLKSREEYYRYIHSENLSSFFPENPRIYYNNKGWKGWVDWLGLNTHKKKEVKHYLQFEIARQIIQNLKLTSYKDWEHYIESNDRNPEIPEFPHITYRQFISFEDWIGVDSDNKWKSYIDGKKFVSKLGIKSAKEWLKYAKSNERPSDIPSNPQRTYKYIGWISWEDWLGNQNISFGKVKWLDFESARKIVHNKNLLNEKEWLDWSKSDEFPNNIPRVPRSKYKNSGWKGMTDWLGCQKNIFGIYLPFEEARTFVRSLEMKNVKEWNKFKKSQKKPIDIPASPEKVYKSNGWLNWTDWLGKTPDWNGEYLDYESAKNYARTFLLNSMKEWRNHTKNPKFPFDIPKSPHSYYKNKGWKGWADFLGKNI